MNNHIISTKNTLVKNIIVEIDEINTKHLSSSYLKKLEDYKCEFCQKYFKGKEGLHNHVAKIHGTRFEVLSAVTNIEIKPNEKNYPKETKERQQNTSLINNQKEELIFVKSTTKLDLETSLKLEIIQLKKRNKDLENENSQANTKNDKLAAEKISQDKRITKVSNILKILKDKIVEVETSSKQEIKNLKQENEHLTKMKDMYKEEANDSKEKYLIKYKHCETLESQQNSLMDILGISDRKFLSLKEKLENLLKHDKNVVNVAKETNDRDEIQKNYVKPAENLIQLKANNDISVRKDEKQPIIVVGDENLIRLKANNEAKNLKKEIVLTNEVGNFFNMKKFLIENDKNERTKSTNVTATNGATTEIRKEKFKNIICMPKLFTFDPAEFPFRCRLLDCHFGAKIHEDLKEHTIEKHPNSPFGRSLLNSGTTAKSMAKNK